MDVVVEVGGWEHECCGSSFERNQVVDLHCIRFAGDDGQMRLLQTHHDIRPERRVRGRVSDIHVVQAGATRAILRLPSGKALRGFDPDDDGHLQDPWTGEVITSQGQDFLVTVQVSD